MTNARHWLMEKSMPVTHFFGHLHAPFSHKLFTGDDYREFMFLAEPGDIVLTHIRGEFSNLFIPGFWKHASMFVNKYDGIFQAIGTGTEITPPFDFLKSKDYVCLLRAEFCDKDTRLLAANASRMFIGYPYDYYFEPGSNALYCSEAVLECYRKATDKFSPFIRKDVFGVESVLPQDYWLAKTKFKVIFVSRATRKENI